VVVVKCTAELMTDKLEERLRLFAEAQKPGGKDPETYDFEVI